jgi:hypothetical protein
VTTVKGTDHRALEVPETWFQREYLPRLPSE